MPEAASAIGAYDCGLAVEMRQKVHDDQWSAKEEGGENASIDGFSEQGGGE